VLVVGGLPAGSKDLAGAREQARGVGAVLGHARNRRAARDRAAAPMYAADRACVNT
jgi:hypothetical protein